MVSRGELGVKSGKGFYTYGDAEEARRARDTHIMKMIAAIRKVDEEMEAQAEKKRRRTGRHCK